MPKKPVDARVDALANFDGFTAIGVVMKRIYPSHRDDREDEEQRIRYRHDDDENISNFQFTFWTHSRAEHFFLSYDKYFGDYFIFAE